MYRSLCFAVINILILTASLPAAVSARVLVHDSVATGNEEIMIMAETKGRFFASGGELVEFFVNGQSLGRVLSGGDGFAYKPFTPRRYGLHAVVVESGDDNDRGVVLSLKKGSMIVFIDVEGSLLSMPFLEKPVEKSREAIKKIMKKFPIVYLQTHLVGTAAIKSWLRKNKFPESAVLPWQGDYLFDKLDKKGFKIKAVIGSQEVIESAGDYKPEVFSFDKFDGAGHAADWEEIEKKLR